MLLVITYYYPTIVHRIRTYTIIILVSGAKRTLAPLVFISNYYYFSEMPSIGKLSIVLALHV